ncbi:MAG: hypothetical protein A3B74_02240 [Candidatus Kerfeldbacteria bacterium RIFCSPHIGHO2_02_FULL_42_14]|uniref:DUF2652 domain-containing protein n=1 Tax=Candidatus Kerfeldbacteria bacterium RIFCSPHIGHO2_02_FULL_42_14 TaxID=1798540 RepID=A0A1G2ARN5_9BACT|nr:MAG: hypothetical protein A3B74_02240 [Candidatus Kerfeldbacteria bacterium RIFCSPHIGHO2_02_FULL_42_14]OGY80368.1 MAG: hypothetical protein A3E60_04860 [Candidatus Kerfeldbacteria bacterium RIFCSPHIGHO2_12_FULL_42_13]OGY83797.1 MAG: hypothetical protein A3I91_04385 [Candidatus Kerfeldbacteria bacterium RIFCSPLOWO2_02_FULL_42_19]OGY87136.1 MAG: hypothetical protein A3G01_04625 [Candidatus Kerfeldbacteria bacterium RIFCSPLOWO2_12_FULL_43_9]
MNHNIRETIIVLADISGYTRFIIAHATALAHTQTIISELIHTLLSQVQPPLQVAEIEGDALFLYARKDDDIRWEEFRKQLGKTLLKFMEAFMGKIEELQQSNLCSCTPCRNVDQLKLKIIVHKGESLAYTLDKFMKISGVDVILAHRLLKNSADAHEYILMTAPAYDYIRFPMDLAVDRGTETYEHIGGVKTYIHIPEKHNTAVDTLTQKQFSYDSLFFKIKNMVIKVFVPLLAQFRLKKLPKLRKLEKVMLETK